LLIEEDLASEIYVCPSSSDTRAIGPTTQATVAALGQPGHVSYVYLGSGLVDPVAPNSVIAYDSQLFHKDHGINVLFADGHVEMIGKKVVPAFLQAANAANGTFQWKPADKSAE